jgi:hypothetical protein
VDVGATKPKGHVMAARAVASPDEIEQFARELQQFNAELAASMLRIRRRFQHLGDSWRDQEQQKFARDFEQTMHVLQQFMQSSETQAPLLMRKAAQLRAYLGQQ